MVLTETPNASAACSRVLLMDRSTIDAFYQLRAWLYKLTSLFIKKFTTCTYSKRKSCRADDASKTRWLSPDFRTLQVFNI